jgi:hypothetical protein
MGLALNSDYVWREVEKRIFACLSFVTAAGEARSAGICYIVADHKLLIATQRDSWKARHIAGNPHVAITVTIPKRIPFLPWIQVPAATISFHGTATLRSADTLDERTRRRLLGANASRPEELAGQVIIAV